MGHKSGKFTADRADLTSTFHGHMKLRDAGKTDITTDGSGDGTTAVTFNHKFPVAPLIVITAQEADTTGTLCATSPAVTGFTAQVDGSSVTTGTLTVGWIAIAVF